MTPTGSEVFLRTQSDERLVTLTRSGHPQAFDAIVARYERELLAFARRSGAEARAEDVVQQSLLNAFVALRGGTEVAHLRGWLYAIVRRALWRAPAVASVQALGEEEVEAAVSEPLEDVVLRRARLREALAAVRALPGRQRDALLATVLLGQSRADIAHALGQSESVVRQLVHRARTNLRRATGAFIPYPSLRWLPGLRAAPDAVAPAAELAGSGRALPAAGVLAKLGVAVASGVLATGAFVVPDHAGPVRATHPAIRPPEPVPAPAPAPRVVVLRVQRRDAVPVTVSLRRAGERGAGAHVSAGLSGGRGERRSGAWAGPSEPRRRFNTGETGRRRAVARNHDDGRSAAADGAGRPVPGRNSSGDGVTFARFAALPRHQPTMPQDGAREVSRSEKAHLYRSGQRSCAGHRAGECAGPPP